jgi:hypothetical protein
LINYEKIKFRKKEQRYNWLLNSKDIISWGTNLIEESEETAAYQWWTNHPCFKRAELEQEIEFWSPYPNIHFKRTSIANTILVVCPICREEEDVTDYELW